MRLLAFGSYDAEAHPRVAVLLEGLRRHGLVVDECNEPLRLDTAARVRLLQQPWRLPRLLAELARVWWVLVRGARRAQRPDAVLVGYLGHFDVLLARLLFRGTPIVHDMLVFASDTARDRGAGGLKQRLLASLDAAAVRASDLVVVDTEEHLRLLPAQRRSDGVVVPVGVPAAWTADGAAATARRRAGAGGVLRTVHPAAGRAGDRPCARAAARRAAGARDDGRLRPGPRRRAPGGRRPRRRRLGRLGRARRPAGAGGRPRRLPRHLRPRRQGAARRAEQGLPGRGRGLRRRHVRHRAAAAGARRLRRPRAAGRRRGARRRAARPGRRPRPAARPAHRRVGPRARAVRARGGRRPARPACHDARCPQRPRPARTPSIEDPT